MGVAVGARERIAKSGSAESRASSEASEIVTFRELEGRTDSTGLRDLSDLNRSPPDRNRAAIRPAQRIPAA
jgi:hypothetical protein